MSFIQVSRQTISATDNYYYLTTLFVRRLIFSDETLSFQFSTGLRIVSNAVLSPLVSWEQAVSPMAK